jgi:hypothetical protein
MITIFPAFCKKIPAFISKNLPFRRKSPLLSKYCGFAFLPKQEELPHSELGWDVRIPAKTGAHSCRLKITSSLGLFCLVDDCFGDVIDGFAGLVVRFGGFDLLCNLSKTAFNLQQLLAGVQFGAPYDGL